MVLLILYVHAYTVEMVSAVDSFTFAPLMVWPNIPSSLGMAWLSYLPTR